MVGIDPHTHVALGAMHVILSFAHTTNVALVAMENVPGVVVKQVALGAGIPVLPLEQIALRVLATGRYLLKGPAGPAFHVGYFVPVQCVMVDRVVTQPARVGGAFAVRGHPVAARRHNVKRPVVMPAI